MATIDLDALVPETVKVVLGGEAYTLKTRDGMPVSAVFRGMKFAQKGEPTPEELIEFLSQVTPIPLALLQDLNAAQLKALVGVVFPKVDDAKGAAAESSDPTQGESPTPSSGETSPTSARTTPTLWCP